MALLASVIPGASAESPDTRNDVGTDDPADKPAKSDSAGPPPTELKSAVDLIRTTARSIVTAFAAIAALVIGTAPLDKIGGLEPWSWQFLLAGGALLTVIAAIAFVISQAAAISAPVGASPQELKIAEHPDGPVPASLADDHEEIEEAARWIKQADLVDVRDVDVDKSLKKPVDAPDRPITFLADMRDLARDQWLQGQLQIEAADDEAMRLQREKANAGRKARLKRLDDELTYVISLANYRRLDRRFNSRKKRIVYASALAAAGIIVFKYAAYVSDATPTPTKLDGVTLGRAVGVDLTGASLAGANLARADLRRAKLTSANLTAANLTNANLRRTQLTGANLSAANLEGADGLTPEDVKDATWIGATCPDGTRLRATAETCESEQRLDGGG